VRTTVRTRQILQTLATLRHPQMAQMAFDPLDCTGEHRLNRYAAFYLETIVWRERDWPILNQP